MKAIAILGVLAAAITAGIAGYWYGPRSGERGKRLSGVEQQGGEPNGTGPNDQLRRQLAHLERQVAALSAREVEERFKDHDEEQPAKAAPTEPITHAEQVERDRVAWESHIAKVHESFQAEVRDPRWAGSTTELLRKRAASDKVVGAALRDIDCRSTVCRLEMLDDQKGEFERELPIFLQGLSTMFPMGQARTVDNPDGTKTLSIYLSTTAGEGLGSEGG